MTDPIPGGSLPPITPRPPPREEEADYDEADYDDDWSPRQDWTPRYELLTEAGLARDRRLEERRRQSLEQEKRWLQSISVHKDRAALGNAGDSADADKQPYWDRMDMDAKERAKKMNERRRQAVEAIEQENRALQYKALPYKHGKGLDKKDNKEPAWMKLQEVAKEKERRLGERRLQLQAEELQWMRDNSIHKAHAERRSSAGRAADAGPEASSADRTPRWQKLNEHGRKRDERLEERRKLKSREEKEWMDKHSIHKAPALGEGARSPPRSERWQEMSQWGQDRDRRLEEKRRQLAEEEQRWLEWNRGAAMVGVHHDVPEQLF